MKIAFWAIIVLFAGYAVIRGLSSFVFGRGGTVCNWSSVAGEECHWALGAAAFSGFFLILFALLLFFSSRSLIQAIGESGMAWRTEVIVWQTLLVIVSLVALQILAQLWNGAVVRDIPCLAPNPTGSVWMEMDGGRFDEVECTGSAWSTLFPGVALIASLVIAVISIIRLRQGRRPPETPGAGGGSPQFSNL